MVHMLFEDNESTPISQLLLNSSYGSYIHFSKGNFKLASMATDLLNTKDVTGLYIFMDCPPNNMKIRKMYSLLCSLMEEKENVEIFPIVCIEEIVIRMLMQYYKIPISDDLHNLVENVVYKFDWSNLNDRFKYDEYIGSSLEHAYKYILSNLTARCLHNDSSGVVNGKFYMEDCNCDRRFCKHINSNDSRSVKAEKLYTTLPAFIKVDESVIDLWKSMQLEINESTVDEIKIKLRYKFDLICDSMGEKHIWIS
jgi:hypothetical protein